MVLLSHYAFGLGIAPAVTNIPFKPYLDKNFSIRLVNDEGLAANLSVGVRGELAQYITLFNTSPSLTPNKEHTMVKFNIKLPAIMDVGRQLGYIIVSRSLPRGGISTNIAINHKVVVEVPPEYGRITARLNATLGLLFVRLKNPKPEHAVVDFALQLLEDNKSVFEHYQKGISLAPFSDKLLKLSLGFEREGEFLANYSIKQNTTSLEETKIVNIGKPRPKIEVITGELRAGVVNPVGLVVTNNWNKDFRCNVIMRVLKDSKRVLEVKSEDFTLERYGKHSLNLYLDAIGLNEGDYKLIIELHFGDKKVVLTRAISLKAPSISPAAVPSKPNWGAIIAGLALLVLSCIAVLLVVKKRR